MITSKEAMVTLVVFSCFEIIAIGGWRVFTGQSPPESSTLPLLFLSFAIVKLIGHYKKRKVEITWDAAVEVIEVHFSPARTGLQKFLPAILYLDWKNIGTMPVRLVVGDICSYNAEGEVVSRVTGVTLYITEDSTPGIAPGEIYRGQKMKGRFILEDSRCATGPMVKADATITLASSKSGT